MVKKASLNILIIDDEANIRKTLSMCLESAGHRTTAAGSAKDALNEAGRQVFDMAFLDLRLGADNGLDIIGALTARSPWMKIIVMTAYASVNTAVEAMRRGAFDYIAKPFAPEQIYIAAEKIGEIRNMESQIARLKEDMEKINPEIDFTSSSPEMQLAVETAKQAAASEAVVLIRGSSGTGKTALAKAIHNWSPRAMGPMGVVSCPSLSPELLESELFGHVKGAFTGAVKDTAGRVAACEGGTLFLDEIGDVPLQVQPKLLRFIQERVYERLGDPVTRKADVRIIAATNADLEEYVKDGRFREDLYYRLNVIQIEIPPLSGRKEDIEAMANRMLLFFSSQNHKKITGFTPEAMEILKNYPWKGNIRELRNVVERIAILSQSDIIGPEHLPQNISPASHTLRIGDKVPLDKIEEEHIKAVINSSKSLQDAAEVLNIDQTTLWRKRKQYGI